MIDFRKEATAKLNRIGKGDYPEVPGPDEPEEGKEELASKAFAWVTGNRSAAGVEFVGRKGQRVGIQYATLFMPVMTDQSKITLYCNLLGVKIEIEGRALGMLAELMTSCQVYRVREQDEAKDDEHERGFVTGIRIEKIKDGDDVTAIAKLFG